MDSKDLTKEQFLRDVQDHEIEVLKDEGLYRHLKFSKDGSFDRLFEVVTWPGYLSIVGDMGEFIFQRTEDMFSFFRDRSGELGVNLPYWSEKVVAESVFGAGIKEFNVEEFKEAVLEEVLDYFNLETKEEICEETLDEIEGLLECEDEYQCVEAMRNFYWIDHPNLFVDFWENNLDRYTFHFAWCCYAVAWAVMQYDKRKENE